MNPDLEVRPMQEGGEIRLEHTAFGLPPADLKDALIAVAQYRIDQSLSTLANDFNDQLGPEEHTWLSGARARMTVASVSGDLDTLQGIRAELEARAEAVRVKAVKEFRGAAVGIMFDAVSYTHLTLPTIYSV